MGRNIAILVGNTAYDKLTQLNCCERDVQAIDKLLVKTRKYNTIVKVIDGKIDDVKSHITKQIEEEDSIGELFFFFSGHGYANVEDFYMCFAQFDELSPNSTGLSRTDLLSLIRPLKPQLTVVVIDACQAGKNIIKDNGFLPRPTPKVELNSFIQFASCLEEQVSWGGEDLSLFTDSFIDAALYKEEGVIYYLDVENALRDRFLAYPTQTPHFTRQGTSLEVFCEDASYLSDLRVHNRISNLPVTTALVDEVLEPDRGIRNAIKRLEALEIAIPDRAQAQAFIDGVIGGVVEFNFAKSHAYSLFKPKILKQDGFYEVKDKKAIVNLIRRRGITDNFVQIETTYSRQQLSMAPFMSSLLGGAGEERVEIHKLFNNCDLKSLHFEFRLVPEMMALSCICLEIVFIPRLIECLLIYRHNIMLRSGWGSFDVVNSTREWDWKACKWDQDPSTVANELSEILYQFVEDYILGFERKDGPWTL